MSKWASTPLGVLAEIRTGKLDSNHAVPGGSYPFFTCAPDPLRIDEYAFDCEAVLLAGNNANGVFHLNRYRGKFNAYQRTYVITPKETAATDTGFLFYTLRTLLGTLGHYSQGTATKFLTMRILSQLQIPTPQLAEQRAIARILGTLDDKIELNRRLNQTLEALARALFKSWFVDFDPVVAKAGGRQPVGMNAETARLFPSEFTESTFGRIPKTWKVERLGEHLAATKGLSYKGSGLSDTGRPLHNLNSVLEGGGYKYEGIKWYVGDYAQRHLIRPGDVIVANTEQGHDCLLIGYAAIVPETFRSEAIYSHHLFRLQIRDGSPLSADFVCRLLNTDLMHDTVSGYGNGTTVNMLPAQALEQPEFVRPPEQLISHFSRLAEIARKRCECLVEENRTLAALRDALLPRLLSGEVRVQNVQETGEHANDP